LIEKKQQIMLIIHLEKVLQQMFEMQKPLRFIHVFLGICVLLSIAIWSDPVSGGL
jgi:hypothetical protein